MSEIPLVPRTRLSTGWSGVGIGLLIVGLSACGGAGPDRAVSSEVKSPRSTTAEETREGEDWPVFLGPRGTGVSGETGILHEWPENGPPVLWSKRVGTGYSAPSALGEKLVLHHRIGRDEIVECMNAASGETIWTYRYESNYQDPYGYNNGPRCTPLLTSDRCYTYGAEGMLLCLDLQSGEKIWMRDIQREYTLPDSFFGVGCTPILEGDLLIVLVGGQPNSGVVAFNAETGEPVWEAVGKETWDGVETGWPGRPRYEWTGREQIVSYSSPIAATIHGRRHILCLVRHGLVSLDPKTGDVNFKYWFRSRLHESVNAARPVVIGDTILLAAAYQVGSVLLRVSESGDAVQEVWRQPRLLHAHWSTPIHVDGSIYGFSGRNEPEATLQCLDAKTGRLMWETNGFDGEIGDLAQDPRTGRMLDRRTGRPIPWPFFGRGSKIQVEDKFIVLGERGTLALVKIDPEKFEEIERTADDEIGFPSWTAPVLGRKRLYLRDEDSLLCLDVAAR